MDGKLDTTGYFLTCVCWNLLQLSLRQPSRSARLTPRMPRINGSMMQKNLFGSPEVSSRTGEPLLRSGCEQLHGWSSHATQSEQPHGLGSLAAQSADSMLGMLGPPGPHPVIEVTNRPAGLL
eukprot:37588-Chlamydomonas_euryale.AAC.1